MKNSQNFRTYQKISFRNSFSNSAQGHTLILAGQKDIEFVCTYSLAMQTIDSSFKVTGAEVVMARSSTGNLGQLRNFYFFFAIFAYNVFFVTIIFIFFFYFLFTFCLHLFTFLFTKYYIHATRWLDALKNSFLFYVETSKLMSKKAHGL